MAWFYFPLFAVLAVTGVTRVCGQCELKLDSAPKWLPLIWENQSSVLYPLENSAGVWTYTIPKSKSVKIACSPILTNLLATFKLQEALIKCSFYSKLNGPNGSTTFDQFGCTGMIKEQIVETATTLCPGLLTVEIQHQALTATLPLIKMCYNPISDATILAAHTIHGASLNPYEVSNNRPTFKSSDFYPQFSVSTAYMQSEQLKTMAGLVGSDALAEEYIDVSKSFYFARGHLAPDGDFVHVYEQNATYYYVNVIPQWQCINNGNWKAMEVAVRNYAINGKLNLKIYTGAHETLELIDASGDPIAIFLGKNQLLPVPKFTFKVVHDVSRNAAVVIIMLNNPHVEYVEEIGSPLCPDVSDQISWMTWNRSDFRKGYSYACEVAEARKAIPVIPDLGTVSLLT